MRPRPRASLWVRLGLCAGLAVLTARPGACEGLSREEFDAAIGLVESVYAPDFAARRLTLRVRHDWDSEELPQTTRDGEGSLIVVGGCWVRR